MKTRNIPFTLAIVGLMSLATSQAQFINTSNTIGLYHLNESSGNVAADDFTNPLRTPHPGTTSGSDGGPAWVPALFDNGLLFNTNSNDKLDVGQASRYVSDLTIQFYINIPSFTGVEPTEGQFFGQTEGFVARFYLSDDQTAWRMQWNVRAANGDYSSVMTPAFGTADNISFDSWTQISFTRYFDGATTSFGIYKEGTLVASNSFAGAYWADAGVDMNVYFGGGTDRMGYTLDEVRFLDGPAIPEPSVIALCALAIVGLGYRRYAAKRPAHQS